MGCLFFPKILDDRFTNDFRPLDTQHYRYGSLPDVRSMELKATDTGISLDDCALIDSRIPKLRSMLVAQNP